MVMVVESPLLSSDPTVGSTRDSKLTILPNSIGESGIGNPAENNLKRKEIPAKAK